MAEVVQMRRSRMRPSSGRRLRGLPPKRLRRRRSKRNRVPWIAAGLFLGVTFGYLQLSPGLSGAAPDFGSRAEFDAVPDRFVLCSAAPGRANCVIDGDTIRIGGVRIRLADIDTPETHEPRCASEAELGKRATHRLLELINDGPIDVVRAEARDEDRYGRKLRVLERDGRSLGNNLVSEGLARPWDGARRGWCG